MPEYIIGTASWERSPRIEIIQNPAEVEISQQTRPRLRGQSFKAPSYIDAHCVVQACPPSDPLNNDRRQDFIPRGVIAELGVSPNLDSNPSHLWVWEQSKQHTSINLIRGRQGCIIWKCWSAVHIFRQVMSYTYFSHIYNSFYELWRLPHGVKIKHCSGRR